MDNSAEKQMKKVISLAVVQKYCLLIKNLQTCPEAWKRLETHYDQHGEDSLLKMNSMYGSFMKLSDVLKVSVIDKVEKGELKAQSKYFDHSFSLFSDLILNRRY